MKTAIFGGSFNPVHNGHINLVKEICRKVSLDRVIVMPTYISPFKKDDSGFVADGKDRLEMCRLAFEDCGFAEVSGYELSRAQVSYSVDTVAHFREIYPHDELFFIMGSDMLLSFEKWHRFKDILKMCSLIAASREDKQSDLDLLEEKAEQLRAYGQVIITEISAYEMSSTLIREKIMKNQDISCYMPEKVVKYIEDNHIYG
ncbi:MAG: nicotinate (nicotinamide) nucleotide adenylyltransferase [Oscillospiraceae bacterium]